MDDPLLHITAKIVTLSGGVAEHSGENSLDVLLPPGVAKNLGVPEETTLRVNSPADIHGNAGENDSNTDSSVRFGKGRAVRQLSYTAETLDKLSALIEGRGLFLERCAKRLYLKQEGMGPAVIGYFTPLNGPARVLTSRVQTVSYLLCNTHYTAFSDERKEGVVETAVNEFTGLPVDDVHSLLQQTETTGSSPPAVIRKPTDQFYRALLRTTQQSIERELQQFHQSLHRRLERDFRRVEEYYGSLVREIEGKIRRKDLQGKERTAELQRVEAIQIELRKKLLDQRERYAVKTAVRWLNALRVYLDVIVVVYEVQRKKRTRELLLIWNPLKKGFEDLSCEHCGGDLRSFWMCDEVPHILCPQCNACPKCGKNVCRSCYPQQCPRCQQTYN
jgi:hypothetical protein